MDLMILWIERNCLGQLEKLIFEELYQCEVCQIFFQCKIVINTIVQSFNTSTIVECVINNRQYHRLLFWYFSIFYQQTTLSDMFAKLSQINVIYIHLKLLSLNTLCDMNLLILEV